MELPTEGASVARATRVLLTVSLVPMNVGVCSGADGLPRIPEEHTPRVVANWEAYHMAAADSGTTGAEDSRRIQLLIFSDFQCASCAALVPVLAELESSFGDQLVVRWRHFPILGHLSEAAAMASECARRQGKFEQLHLRLFAKAPDLSTTSWRAMASEAGVPSPDQLQTCIGDPETRRIVRSHVEMAERLGATVTPTLLLDSLLFKGSPHQRYLRAYIRLELERRP